MKLAAQFELPEQHADDMRQAIADGDESWMLELLYFARLTKMLENGHLVGVDTIDSSKRSTIQPTRIKDSPK